MPGKQKTDTPIVAGLDLGAVQNKIAVIQICCEGVRPLFLDSQFHQGKVVLSALKLIEKAASISDSALTSLGVTGTFSDFFTTGKSENGVVKINQLIGAVSGVRALLGKVGTIFDLGGQFAKWIKAGDGDKTANTAIDDFALNGLCAAGSGIFLEQQAARLQLTVQQLGEIALQAEKGAKIAGRCSVFAKSDMIHLQQKGTPVDEIAYGLCLALSRTFLSSIPDLSKLPLPITVIGGGGENPGLMKAFKELLDCDPSQFLVPEYQLFACAIGTAIEAGASSKRSLIDWHSTLVSQEIKNKERKLVRNRLPRLRITQGEGITDKKSALPVDTSVNGSKGCHLGIDVGSVSTNLVLLSPDLEFLDGIYLATAGRPVQVLDQGLQLIKNKHGEHIKILSVGTTGSGRYLAEKLVGADLVKNEISTQLASAVAEFPDVDTIIEIGGQDAKFIGVADGLLRDFEMNKICSAGTGSFLEEQAERLGVAIIDEFAELALKSQAPFDFGGKCTVFMDAELGEAIAGNADIGDLCAGLAYSVARNYLEKVAGGRTIGETIVFQGGTSANQAVVSAFTNLLGRPIQVHPYGKLSGAIGVARLAAGEVKDKTAGSEKFRGFESCGSYSIKSFYCKKCENQCQVNQITVDGHKAHFGDSCERYSSLDKKTNMIGKSSKKKQRNFFLERERLLQTFWPEPVGASRERIGLLRSTMMIEHLPFWANLLDRLGFTPVFTPLTEKTDSSRQSSLPAEVCLPLKCAQKELVRLLDENLADKILLPSILEYSPLHPKDRVHTCLYSQQHPYMVGETFSDRILIPQCGFSAGGPVAKEGMRVIADVLGVPLRTVKKHWQKAIDYQNQFCKARLQLGKEALSEFEGYGVVVVGKPYNLYNPQLNLGLAGHFEQLNLFALPMDLLPFAEIELGSEWYMLPWMNNRNQLRILKLINERYPNLFPVHVSNYGCGPDSFSLKHFQHYWGNRPRMLLQFDEHTGEAGLITRLEAFIDEIDTYTSYPQTKVYSGSGITRDNVNLPSASRCLIPYFSEHVYAYAGMLERQGLHPVILDPPSEETVRRGEKFTTGQECHPYTIIAGDLVRLVEEEKTIDGDRFFLPTTRLPCLLSQYGDGLYRIIEDMGETKLKLFDQHPGEAMAMFGTKGVVDLYEGLTMIDYLIIAACHYRPYEKEPGAVGRELLSCCESVKKCLARKKSKAACMEECISSLESVPRHNNARRPLIGVTGDLYTRMNSRGNNALFLKLEQMGCEVWASPFYAASTDFELPQDSRRWMKKGQPVKAVINSSVARLLLHQSRKLASVLPPGLRQRCVETEQSLLQEYAEQYTGENSNHLIRTIIGKMVDFAKRDADGIISVIGLNCMAGTIAGTAVSRIRKENNSIPILTMTCSTTEGLHQKIQLDTFVQQVEQRMGR